MFNGSGFAFAIIHSYLLSMFFYCMPSLFGHLVTVSAMPQPQFWFKSLPCYCLAKKLNTLPPSVLDCKSLSFF